MKRILKKNQLIIAALAVMISAAGYLNYSGRLLPGSQNTKEAGSDLANKELLDISDEDVAAIGVPTMAASTGTVTQAQ